MLQDIQEHCRYLPEEALRQAAGMLDLPLRDVYGVASFYQAFNFTPVGRFVLTVCVGTACHVRGGAVIVEALTGALGIPPGGTTADGLFTLKTVNCLGCCAIGPIVVVNEKYHGEMDTRKALALVRDLRKEDARG